jgi:hypothetical protein
MRHRLFHIIKPPKIVSVSISHKSQLVYERDILRDVLVLKLRAECLLVNGWDFEGDISEVVFVMDYNTDNVRLFLPELIESKEQLCDGTVYRLLFNELPPQKAVSFLYEYCRELLREK